MNTHAERYARDGFTIIPGLIAPEMLHKLKENCRELLATHATQATVLMGASVMSPPCRDLGEHPDLVAVLRTLMPDGVAFLSDKVVVKNSSHRFATPWHQDIAYWPGTRPKISVWFALDDAEVSNGALRVIPGSHRTILAHQRSGANGADNTVPTGEFFNFIALGDNPDGAMSVVLPAGSALIFSDRLVHGSHTNESGSDRWSLIGTYQAPAADEPFDLPFAARRTLAG